MTACSKDMMTIGASGDLAVMCQKIKESVACLKKIDDCPEGMQTALDAAIKGAENSANCASTDGDGGDMGTCKMSEIEECTKPEPKNEEEGCKMVKSVMKCVTDFAAKCKSKQTQTIIEGAQEEAVKTLKMCKDKGYSTESGGDAGESIKPSFMLVLAAAIVLAVRAHF